MWYNDLLSQSRKISLFSGDDTITGNSYTNVLQGASGNDILKGLGGNDILYGGSGMDHLTGKWERTLYGGLGTDTAYYSGTFNSYILIKMLVRFQL